MKRLMSAFLLLAFLLATSSPALALSQDQSNLNEATINIEYVGHGEYQVSNSNENSAIDTIENAESGDVFNVSTSVTDDIIYLNDDQCLIKAGTDSYLLVDKMTVDTDNFNANKELFDENNISKEAQERIEKAISEQKSMGNDDFSIEIFVPSEVETSYIAADPNEMFVPSEIEMSYAAANPTITNATYTFYDKMGDKWFIRDTSIKYTGLWSPQVIKKGTQAKPMASAFANLVISAAGTVSTTVSVFGVGKSLYDVYVAARGPVVSGSGTDQTYSWLYYDRIEKESYFSGTTITGTYYLGKTSHKVWINKLTTRQLYTGNATPFDKDFTVNKEHYSKYWSDNQMTIDRWQWEDYIKTKLYDTTVVLNSEG